ncbi:hypothetical protein RUM43_009704 [Polyplax serrata]|uniref:Uncharacterized protein n=1 Tax=Polyplax serrata TaxID=468196 RepID=A0AAN8Q3V5_POLSC
MSQQMSEKKRRGSWCLEKTHFVPDRYFDSRFRQMVKELQRIASPRVQPLLQQKRHKKEGGNFQYICKAQAEDESIFAKLFSTALWLTQKSVNTFREIMAEQRMKWKERNRKFFKFFLFNKDRYNKNADGFNEKSKDFYWKKLHARIWWSQPEGQMKAKNKEEHADESKGFQVKELWKKISTAVFSTVVNYDFAVGHVWNHPPSKKGRERRTKGKGNKRQASEPNLCRQNKLKKMYQNDIEVEVLCHMKAKQIELVEVNINMRSSLQRIRSTALFWV